MRYKNEIISSLIQSENKLDIFKEIPLQKKGFILLELPKKYRIEIISKLKNPEILKILHYLDPDEATDLLQCVDVKIRKFLITKVSQEIRDNVEQLLRFDSRVVADMVSFDYLNQHKNDSFEKVSKIIKKHEKRTGRVPTILVMEEDFLLGEFQPHWLGLKPKNSKLKDYVKKIPFIKITDDGKTIIETFKKHPHNKIVVLEEDNTVLGIIFTDDVLKLVEKNSQDNLIGFTGLSKEEDVFDSAFEKVKNRYKWLIINLFTVFLAAGVISLFEETVSSLALIAIYLPVVAGMGGNTGTQTLAIMVRGLALKEIELKNSKKVLLNEVLAGGMNGVINGILVALVIAFWNKNLMFGIVVGLAMIFSLMIAGFFGGIIPLIMKKLGKDPATSATIFITTATDIFGFLVYLGLASIML